MNTDGLYHEVRGAGPVLLLVCGGIYDAQGFADLADALADRYTVVTYDRRGNSRSALAGPPLPTDVTTQAEDAYRLLRYVSPDAPAAVFGNSSGGVIALELALRHPDAVRTVVVHEPPLFTVLPDRDHWRAVMDSVAAAFRDGGVGAAFGTLNAAFAADTPPPADRPDDLGPAADPETTARQLANAETFVGYEVPGFAPYEPDLAAVATRVVVAVGDGAEGEVPWVRAARALAARLGTRPEMFPGGHGGFGGPTAPAFAARLADVLAG